MQIAPEHEHQPCPTWQDRALSLDEVNLRGARVAMGILVLAMASYTLVWQSGAKMWPEDFAVTKTMVLIGVVPVFILSLIAHELIHAGGFLLATRKVNAIRIGVFWSHFTPYAHCNVPISARSYRLAIALPAIVLGVVPLFAGVICNIGAMAAYGAIMFALAAGDILVLQCLHGVPPQALVRDHPDKAGCQVLI